MHYRIFDLWRFVAAVLIMLYHFLYSAPYEMWLLVGPIVQRPTGLLDLFFMISGFLVMARYGGSTNTLPDLLNLLRRRLAVLYPLHLLTLLFFLPVAFAAALGCMPVHNPQRWDLATLPQHLLLVHAWGTTEALGFNLPSWSVSAEFFCYLAFPLVLLFWRRGGLAGLVLLLVAWIALLEVAWQTGHLGEAHWSRANVFGAYRAFVGLVAGGLIYRLVERFGRPFHAGLWAGQGFVLAALALMLMEAPPLLPLAFIGAGLYCAAAAERARPALTEGLERAMPLLRLSFGIYLWHMVLAAICYQLVWRALAPQAGPAAYLAFSIVPVAGTILAAYLSQPFQRAAYRAIAGSAREPMGADIASRA